MISCIITTYKRPISVLRRAVESVVAQTFKDIELLIINDYPEDEVLAGKIKNYIKELSDSRIKYISYEYNQGACAARNIGIDRSSGEFIAFLDDDDEWIPDKLECLVGYFSNENVGLVYCDNYIVSKSGISLHRNVPKTGEETVLKNLLLANFIGSTSFPLLRKSAVIDAGKFDENLMSSQDLDLWIRIAEKYDCIYCNSPLTNYYIMDESITTNVKNKIMGYKYLLRKYSKYYELDKRFYNKKYNNIAGELIMSGIYKEGMHFYKSSLKKNFYNVNNIYYPVRAVLLRMRRILKGY